jgi:hypothetical protein
MVCCRRNEDRDSVLKGFNLGAEQVAKLCASRYKDHCSAFIKYIAVEPLGRPVRIVQASCSGCFEGLSGLLLRGAD